MNNNIAMIGLGVMGSSLALNIANHGFKLAAYDRNSSYLEKMRINKPHTNISFYQDLKECIYSLKKPRKVMMMVTSGPAVDWVIEEVSKYLEEGDILIDGGNSFFEDTIKRSKTLKARGIYYFGVGISGGENGALLGPSIIPGGKYEKYLEIQNIFESIAAKTDNDEICCKYIGPNGAGHFVKMLHNGIEYAQMQAINEAYLTLKNLGSYSNQEISDLFKKWNQGPLESYLLKITADILLEKDDYSDSYLLDKIVDSASSKGTGLWTNIEALKLSCNISTITQALNLRTLSNDLTARSIAKTLYTKKQMSTTENANLNKLVKNALYLSQIIIYDQALVMLAKASKVYEWDINITDIMTIFKAGCIIQAKLLEEIQTAYKTKQCDEHLIFSNNMIGVVQNNISDLRALVALQVLNSCPTTVMTAALNYFDLLKAENLGANLIQAQRDYFGAHTYSRIDKEGIFHHQWGCKNG